MYIFPLIFFDYPGPMGSEEPSTKCELDEVKINLLPLRRHGVNKLIFKRFAIYYS
jgi:hypothetical protein